MIPFEYQRATSTDDAVKAIGTRGAKFLGGGTNLIDLMKLDVERPTTLVDVTRLEWTKVEASENGGLRIGAQVRNSDLANHPKVVAEYPLLSQALLSGASPQLRNMATTGGNLLQRTRCYYFADTAFAACNKREPGSGCAAIEGVNRIHAVLGQTDRGPADAHSCIATNPSDMNVALAALGASVHVESSRGKRVIPIAEFHRLPGSTPNVDTNLKPDELITGVELPPSLGGVAHKPWRSLEAEKAMMGAKASREVFRHAAEVAMTGAKGYKDNAFKIELAKQSIVRALTLAARGTSAGAEA